VEVALGELAKSASSGPARLESARVDIERRRRALAKNPNDAQLCNSLAWAYMTAPEPLRDSKAALELAEKAARLAPQNPDYRNTLGAAYYRAGRYREAVETLRPNLQNQEDRSLAFDLFFLAMSHQHLGEGLRARDYYDWGVRWTRAEKSLSPEHIEELEQLRMEAASVLGIKE
jgi:tetratricopeptide (TPR) repeat protein